jgi:hypothetical protein
MTARLAPLPAPKGLRPARSGAAERSPAPAAQRRADMTARLAPLPAPKGLKLARDMTARLAPLPAPKGLRPARSGAAERSPALLAQQSTNRD